MSRNFSSGMAVEITIALTRAGKQVLKTARHMWS